MLANLPSERINESLRAKVLEVSRDANSRKLNIQAQRLDLKTHSSGSKISISLEGVWAQNHISQNSTIHLINPNYDQNSKLYQLDNSRGFLVLEPDNLLTCTYVASSLFCERKTWLNHVFLGQVGTNRAMLVGTLVHEVFQHAVKHKITQMNKLTAFLDELMNDATVMMEIYSVDLHLKEVRAEAISYLASVKEFVENFMLKSGTHPITNDQDLEVQILKIKDIEENVWSTKYGLKGKIDVTGLVRVHNRRGKIYGDKIIPLELKTGNPNLSSSHAAQVSLYSMMIEDRYAETNQGFVIYLKDKAAIHNIALTNNIKRDLIQRRNQVNYSMKNYFLGPEMIDQPRLCKSCDRLTECILMSQMYAPGQIDEYSLMKSLVGDAVSHLDGEFVKFFQKYHEKLVGLISSKESSGEPFWSYSSEEAERRLCGFGKLQVTVEADGQLLTFSRHPKHSWTTNAKGDESAGSSQEVESKPTVKKMKISDFFNSKSCTKYVKPFDTKADFSRCRVAISLDAEEMDMKSQNSSTAIAIGFVNEIKEDQITMKLYEGAFDKSQSDQMYRLDKIEKRAQADIERTVLVRLLAREDWRCDRIRQLLLDSNFAPEKNLKLNHFVLTTGFDEVAILEGEQQKFVVDAFSTDNYYILNERYACNRSEVDKVISTFSRIVSTLGRSVLIVAQNIDNLLDLMKLLRMKKIKFILIDDGKSAKARNQFASHIPKVPQIANFDLALQFDSYLRQHETSPVVITSYAMSVGGLYFVRKTFDYCVAYDCDKTELLLSLSPMFCSDRFVIVDVREGAAGKEQEGERLVSNSKDGQEETLGELMRRLHPWIY